MHGFLRSHASILANLDSSGSDPNISSIKTSTMITRSNSLSRGSGMPNQVDGVLLHTMSDSELSRVRTEL